MQQIAGVLLDVDGTLVDSNDAHAWAWFRAIYEAGFPVDYPTIRKLIGKGGDKLLPEAIGISATSSEGKAISKRRGEIFELEYLPSVKPFPFVKELLHRMKREGLKLAVASSAKEEELKPLLRICGAEEFIETSTSVDDANRSKPDPDIIQAALRQLKASPSQTLLLGDTPYDIEASHRAGLNAVALRCGGWRDADLQKALAIYDSPADLLLRFDESPFKTSTKGAKKIRVSEWASYPSNSW
ncbi:MAG: HAD family hydrolase [Gemmatales bacterium]